MKFKIGDRVRKVKEGIIGSEGYDGSENFKMGEVGIVTKVSDVSCDGAGRIKVNFDFAHPDHFELVKELKEVDLKVGDEVELPGGYKCIVRHIGELDGIGDDSYVWGIWVSKDQSTPLCWDGNLHDSTHGGSLYWGNLEFCKLLRKKEQIVKEQIGKETKMGKYEDLKGRIERLSNGWDKAADDILVEIGLPYEITISHDAPGGYGKITSIPKQDYQYFRRFSFQEGHCEKVAAFRNALMWILDNSDIKNDREEKRKELQGKIESLQGQIADLNRQKNEL